MALSVARIKQIIAFAWLGSIATMLVFFAFRPELLTAQGLGEFMRHTGQGLWLMYVVLSLVRGIFLIPSTPFVLAGAVLFPDAALWIVLVSMTGILLTATFLYYWADWIGLGAYLDQKYPKQTERISYLLNKPYAIFLVIGWAFFPLVPTDLVCYLARIVGMRYRLMMLGIILGELPLVLLLVYATHLFL